MTTVVRAARPGDAAALAALKRSTFRETFVEGGFAIPYPPADLAMFEAQTHARDVVAAELGDPERASWVASRDSVLLGYAQVGPAKLPHADARPAHGEIYQLYVAGRAQGLGLGRMLLDAAIAHLERARPGPIWLGVWKGNLRAQQVYRARGFREVGAYLFPVGAWRDEELVFRRD